MSIDYETIAVPYPYHGILLLHATTWKNLENILSERSQTQKTTYCMVPLI